MVGYSMAQMAQFTFWPTFMRDEFGMSLVTSGWLIGVLGLVVASGGFIVVPLLSRRAGNRAPLLIIGITLCVTFLGTLETDSIPVLVAVLIINGLGRGAFWTIFNTIPFELPGSRPREVALAQALMQTMFWGGGVLGPILVGFIHQATGDLKLAMVVIFIFPIAMTLASLIPSGRVKPRPMET
jgi:cyanate permease